MARLLFDVVYLSEEQDQPPHMLQFLADGTVRAAHNKIALNDPAAAAGTVETKSDGKVAFTTKHRFGTVVYDGEVVDGKLIAQIASSITGWKGRLTFSPESGTPSAAEAEVVSPAVSAGTEEKKKKEKKEKKHRRHRSKTGEAGEKKHRSRKSKAAAATAETPVEAAPATATAAAAEDPTRLKTSGVYVSEEQDQTPHMLQFLEDGTVRAAHNKIALNDPAAAAGTVETKSDGKVAFTTKHRFGTVVYDGEVVDGKLIAQIASSITGWKGRLTFSLVAAN